MTLKNSLQDTSSSHIMFCNAVHPTKGAYYTSRHIICLCAKNCNQFYVVISFRLLQLNIIVKRKFAVYCKVTVSITYNLQCIYDD